MVVSWILGTPQHSTGICGIDFILMQYKGVNNWPGLHCQQYKVEDILEAADRARYKCIDKRSKSVHQQQGVLQCPTYKGNGSGVGEVLGCTIVSC